MNFYHHVFPIVVDCTSGPGNTINLSSLKLRLSGIWSHDEKVTGIPNSLASIWSSYGDPWQLCALMNSSVFSGTVFSVSLPGAHGWKSQGLSLINLFMQISLWVCFPGELGLQQRVKVSIIPQLKYTLTASSHRINRGIILLSENS